MLTKEQIFGMYIGQKVHIESLKPVISRTLLEVATNHIHCSVGNCISTRIDTTKADCKLILRTQEDMTEEEINMFYKLHDDIHCGYDAQHTEYLISIGIDVFNAIGKGWAVRKGEGNETE